MGQAADDTSATHYHLLRKFKGDVDLLLILNTMRCFYNCSFCDLPAKSSEAHIGGGEIAAQMLSGLSRYADSFDVIDRVTLSNEGSVFDQATFDPGILVEIARAIDVIPNIRRLVLETRPEFVSSERVEELLNAARHCILDILVGFETQDDRIRNVTLGKRQSRESLTAMLDALAKRNRVAVTSYVLVKPDPAQTDEEAIVEAKQTVNFLIAETSRRSIPLSVRLNPMYIANKTRWAAKIVPGQFKPPRLSDVFEIARWTEQQGVPAYVGLSTEGLAGPESSYRSRSDFSSSLLKRVIRFNAEPFGQGGPAE